MTEANSTTREGDVLPTDCSINLQNVDVLKKTIMTQELEIRRLENEVSQLKIENHEIKKASVEKFEQEQEAIANKLLQKITELQKDRVDFFHEVEMEEEYLTNSLYKKLVQLQKEKVDLENTLEQEQEYLVNKLQVQMEAMKSHSSGIASPSGTPRLSFSSSPSDIYFPTSLVESLKRENNMLKMKIIEKDQAYYVEMKKLAAENEGLQNELYILKKKLIGGEDIEEGKENVQYSPQLPTRVKRSQSMIAKKKSGVPENFILRDITRKRAESIAFNSLKD